MAQSTRVVTSSGLPGFSAGFPSRQAGGASRHEHPTPFLLLEQITRLGDLAQRNHLPGGATRALSHVILDQAPCSSGICAKRGHLLEALMAFE